MTSGNMHFPLEELLLHNDEPCGNGLNYFGLVVCHG